ncbi:MAG: hypothetical protein DSM106950_11320 [Stigonema ocellatum SAG 48.90 = DSM 106950]|nr:hypothetical protein [Stigonema ocellatum SAG 48.90 = DSM 106950]
MKINKQNSQALTQPISLKDESMLDLEDLTDEECFGIVGGSITGSKFVVSRPAVNFDLNSYLFVVGAGAKFNGGVTTNVVNIAFQQAVFTSSGGVVTFNA